jgi:hypothetical protein
LTLARHSGEEDDVEDESVDAFRSHHWSRKEQRAKEKRGVEKKSASASAALANKDKREGSEELTEPSQPSRGMDVELAEARPSLLPSARLVHDVQLRSDLMLCILVFLSGDH